MDAYEGPFAQKPARTNSRPEPVGRLSLRTLMRSNPPPGRISRLMTAWADWLYEKLLPPEPAAKPRMKTQPPKLVKSDSRTRGTGTRADQSA